MPRKVFFCFHYERDLWRANIVRNTGLIEGFAPAGFRDASAWEEAQQRGHETVRALIDKGIEGTSVTVVLIGQETGNREWIGYEIERSIARRNGIFGVRINSIKDQHGTTDPPGMIPPALIKINAPIYDWDFPKFGEWVEKAHSAAHL